MKKFIKTAILLILSFVMIIPFYSCKKEEGKEKITLQEKLMDEAQIVTDFMKSEGFVYGDAQINPAINWKYLDASKADNPDEKVVSCDRLVDWILYRAGFTNQPYKNGMNVWSLIDWCKQHNFEEITDVNELQAGDIVFVNAKNNMPQHVFMCASSRDEYGCYLRYDAGSNERIQCIKGTEVTPGHQPTKEPIGGFMYAYRPNDSTLDKKYADSNATVNKNVITASFEISKGSAKIDGIISNNEYKSKYTLDSSTATTWVGNINNNSSDIYFAWDEDGLYYAAEIKDNTPSYRASDEESWVGVDCLQLGVNPGNLITPGGLNGILFTFGAKANGEVVSYRHNFSDGIVNNEIDAIATNHVEGQQSYIIEAFIPWESIKLSAKSTVDNKSIDTTSFVPKEGTQIDLLPCVINSNTNSETILAAYKFTGTSFAVSQYVPCKLVK